MQGYVLVFCEVTVAQWANGTRHTSANNSLAVACVDVLENADCRT